jgi:hypothetical protein
MILEIFTESLLFSLSADFNENHFPIDMPRAEITKKRSFTWLPLSEPHKNLPQLAELAQ